MSVGRIVEPCRDKAREPTVAVAIQSPLRKDGSRIDRSEDVRVDATLVFHAPRGPTRVEVDDERHEWASIVAVVAVRGGDQLVLAVGAVDEAFHRE